MGGKYSKFRPPLRRMTAEQAELFNTVTTRRVEDDRRMLTHYDDVVQRVTDEIAGARTVPDFLNALAPERDNLACMPMQNAEIDPAYLARQAPRDLCREALRINGQLFEDHINSDLDVGFHALKQHLHIYLFDKNREEYNLDVDTDMTEKEFHAFKSRCVARVIPAACRTISGGDSHAAIAQLFTSPFLLVTPFVVVL